MQPERQVSIALAAVGAALVFPQYPAASHGPPLTPGVGLVIGGVLGALGVLLGSLVAIDHSARIARVLGVGFWVVVGLALSGGVFLGATHSPTWGLRLVF